MGLLYLELYRVLISRNNIKGVDARMNTHLKTVKLIAKGKNAGYLLLLNFNSFTDKIMSSSQILYQINNYIIISKSWPLNY